MSGGPVDGEYEPPGVHTAVFVRRSKGQVNPSHDNPSPSLYELDLKRPLGALQPCQESLWFLDIYWEDSDKVVRDNPAGFRSFPRFKPIIFDMARLCTDIPRLDSQQRMPLSAVLPPSIRSVLLVVYHPDNVTFHMSGHPEKIRSGQFFNLQEIVVEAKGPPIGRNTTVPPAEAVDIQYDQHAVFCPKPSAPRLSS